MHYHDKLLLLLVLDTEVPFINGKISHFFQRAKEHIFSLLLMNSICIYIYNWEGYTGCAVYFFFFKTLFLSNSIFAKFY